MSLRRTITIAALAVAVVAGCGSDDEETSDDSETSDTTVASSAGGDEPCATLEVLASYNAENELDLTGEWPEVQERLAEVGDESRVVYGQSIEVAPEEPRKWIETLRDWNDEFFAAVAEADSVDVIGEFIQDIPPGVQTATVELNSWLKENCGFGLTEG